MPATSCMNFVMLELVRKPAAAVIATYTKHIDNKRYFSVVTVGKPFCGQPYRVKGSRFQTQYAGIQRRQKAWVYVCEGAGEYHEKDSMHTIVK